MRFLCAANLTGVFLLAISSLEVKAGIDDPAPLPPEPADQKSKPLRKEPPPPETPEIKKYQACLQRMVDLKEADPTFMDRCLGLRKAPAKDQMKASEQASPTVDDLLKQARSKSTAFTACYNELLNRSKNLGVAPQGSVRVHLQIKPNGRADKINFEASSLADPILLNCVKAEVATWSFASFEKAAARWDEGFSMGARKALDGVEGWAVKQGAASIALLYAKFVIDMKVSSKAPLASISSEARLGSLLDLYTSDEIFTPIRRGLTKLKACGAKASKTAPKPLTLIFEIDSDGSANPIEKTPRPALDPCVRSVVKSWKFKRPEALGVLVNLPMLIFSSKPSPSVAPANPSKAKTP